MASSAGNADVHYMSEPVHRTLEVLVGKDTDMLQSITGVKSQLQELATAFVDIDDHDKVPGCRDLFKDLLHLENELNMHIQALQGTKQTYKASEQSTDFKAMLDRKTQQLLASHQFDPEASQDMKAFDRETGAGTAEDDDVVDASAGDLRNDKCPLTMKSVFELQNPVADSMGFIYDKSALIEFLRDQRRKGHGQVRCPVAGAAHVISEGDLRPPAQLERAKRRRNLKKSQAGPSHEHVFDADAL